jgi:hypothetical protein
VSTRRREHLSRIGLGVLVHRRQIADHASGPVGQSLLNRIIQILDDIVQPAGDVKDDCLMYGVSADPCLRASGRAAC